MAKPTKREPLRCSFCGKSQYDVEKLIAGPAIYICDGCTRKVYENTRNGAQTPTVKVPIAGACGFCGKHEADVRCFAASEDGNSLICDECVELCMDILKEEKRTAEANKPPPLVCANCTEKEGPDRVMVERNITLCTQCISHFFAATEEATEKSTQSSPTVGGGFGAEG